MSRGSGVELEEQRTENLSKDTDKVEIVSKAVKYIQSMISIGLIGKGNKVWVFKILADCLLALYISLCCITTCLFYSCYSEIANVE